MNFSKEEDLKKVFVSEISKRLQCIKIQTEVRGFHGKPDVVIGFENHTSFDIVAFELKLKNWSQALTQAFRYYSFASLSYVVLDDAGLGDINRLIDEFQKYNVGLLTIDEFGNLNVYHHPKKITPFSLQSRKKMWNLLSETVNWNRSILNLNSFKRSFNNPSMQDTSELMYI
ncbi:hypothetical protein [Leptospira stimsonii]|uniref:Uncharacterized protein n=1 Tax=Leptospira stimsonii TaxID=2202203 RepID=A0A8B3CNB4_9LEPT|nr:hypothetical protein [Leptospira stimsonii]RHX83587.1 hypothetical protein DLM78_21600 [Leptospira stimsonii]